MEEDGLSEQELANIRAAVIQARKGLAILCWLVAGLLAGWALYLFWVAGEVGVLLLILVVGLACIGARVWESHHQYQRERQPQLLESDDPRAAGAH